MSSRKRFILACLIFIGVWNVFGLIDAVQMVFWRQIQGIPTPWWTCVLVGLCDWYIFAILTPFIFWASVRFPLNPGAWKWPLVLHLSGGVAASLLVLAV